MISRFFKWILGEDYKTTFTGVGGAVAMVALDLYQKGTVDTKTLAIAGTVAALGRMSENNKHKLKDGV